MARKRRAASVGLSLQDLGAKAIDAAIKALNEGADLVIDDAKNRAPVRSGKLRESVTKTASENGSVITITAPAKNKRGVEYGQYVMYDPSINKPFLHDAWKAKRNTVKKLVMDAIKEADERDKR